MLPAASRGVMVRFDYAYALSGTAFTVQWLYEDGLIRQATTEVVIKAAEGLGSAWFATKPPTPLPAGFEGGPVGGEAPHPQLAEAREERRPLGRGWSRGRAPAPAGGAVRVGEAGGVRPGVLRLAEVHIEEGLEAAAPEGLEAPPA